MTKHAPPQPAPATPRNPPANVSVPDLLHARRTHAELTASPPTSAELVALREACAIDQTRLAQEFSRLSADFALWNERLAGAYRAKLMADAELDRVRAMRRVWWRESQAIEGARVTEGSVTDALESDPQYLAARITWIEAEAAYQQLRGVLATLGTKRDMLISLGAHVRAEIEAPTAMRAPGYTNDHA